MFVYDGQELVPRRWPISTTETGTRKFRGRVYIDWNRCKGCGFCVEFCPPKVLALTSLYNDHGYHPPQLIHKVGCTGCDLCGLYCPDFAIYGVREPVAAEATAVRAPETPS
jgi:2-oxoglutarate ferredoxin oxidoreductase subunit delta